MEGVGEGYNKARGHAPGVVSILQRGMQALLLVDC